MIYCDTSLLVAALTIEPQTRAVQEWMAGHDESALCISSWAVTEFSSAIALKLRRGEITTGDRNRALANLRKMQADSLIIVAVPGEVFDLAARFCDMKGSALRAGDALHLAVAALGGHGLATLDARMKDGAEAVGVSVVGV